jgi:hypothetical protein
MSKRTKQPWAILICLLISSVIAWLVVLVVLSGALEATLAPQNLILALAKFYAVASTIGLLFLLLMRLRTPKS